MLIEIGSEVIRFALPTKSDDMVSIGFKLNEELRFSYRTFSLDKFTTEEVMLAIDLIISGVIHGLS